MQGKRHTLASRVSRPLGPLKRFLERQPRWAVACLSLFLVVALGVIDYLSWEDLAFSIFYLAPVAIATWYGGIGTGTMVAFASAATWLAADVATQHCRIPALIHAWNCLVRLGFFLIVMRLLAELHRRLDIEKLLAATDTLTGLANSRVFFMRLNDEAERSRRYGRPLTIVYSDIDDFKAVNDTRGHAAGDETLKAISDAMRRGTRRSDTLARLGGDEFAGIFPETNFAAAKAVTEKLLSHVRAAERNGPALTFSIGAVCFDRPTDDPMEMLRMADALMYEAKRGGKNRVIVRRWPE